MNLIEETGHFHITNTTFDFDLCSLDKTTVRKLQSYLETSGTSWGYNNWMHQRLFFFFWLWFFFSLFVYMKTLRMMQPKGKKIKSKQPSALFFFKASHHLLIKERFSKPASVDHSSLQGDPREELAWIALKTNRSNTTRENLKNVYGITCLSLWWFIPQDECIFNTLPYYITDLFINRIL